MRRNTREQLRPETESAAADEAPAATADTRFSSAGDIPEVAPFGTPGPTASERAFGDGDFLAKLPTDVAAAIKQAAPEEIGALLDTHPELADPIMSATQQLRGHSVVQTAVASTTRMHKPAAQDASSAQTNAPPIAPAPQPTPADPQQAKHWDRAKRAAFDQLATSVPDDRSSVTEVRLPDNIVKQIDQAWRDSFAGKRIREQGGALIRKGGDYRLRREDNESADYFEADERVGWRETLVANVHTHPYEREKVPEGFASFSDGDFDSLMRSSANNSILRSGPYTFMLTKTKQFNALVDRTGNDEAKLTALADQMKACYNTVFEATKGSFSQKIEAAIIAVCDRFHLLYFAGQGADLVRKDQPQP